MFRFGKLPPLTDYRTLRFEAYLKDGIPEPPPSIDLDGRVCKNLNEYSISDLFPMYSNDNLGDCTVAGAAHGVTVYHGMVSQNKIPDIQSVIKVYYHLSGGLDSGLYLMDVVRYWRNIGIEGEKVFAYAKVNHLNHTQVKQAIYLFGGMLVGFQCQEKVMDEFKDKKPWQPGFLINAGHCVYITSYDDQGVEVLTWGALQRGTWEWWDQCVDECYALLPPEAKLPEFTPGFDFEKLKKDLSQVSIL